MNIVFQYESYDILTVRTFQEYPHYDTREDFYNVEIICLTSTLKIILSVSHCYMALKSYVNYTSIEKNEETHKNWQYKINCLVGRIRVSQFKEIANHVFEINFFV